jgi:hypothetical protein
MDLFLDTNTLLSFYHYSSDDLEELRKLAVLVRQREVELYIPSQVVREFRRNREAKIADALKQLREQKISFPFPQMSKDYPEHDELRRLQREYGESHRRLLENLERDIRDGALKADIVVDELLGLAAVIDCNNRIVSAAKDRFELGDPPGKRDSLGDAINWEALLEGLPDGTDLYFISGDRDFASPVDPDRFSDFLSQEWRRRKNGDIHFYKRLSNFLKDHYAQINLETEAEKDQLVQQLAASGSFKATHEIIGRLARYSDFTPAQVEGIVAAVVNNNQVEWIAKDPDVESFLQKAVVGHDAFVDPDLMSDFYDILNDDDGDDIELN